MKQLAILTLSIAFLISACKKPRKEETVKPTGAFKTVEVQVKVPEGVNLDLSTMTISSLAVISEVTSDGRAAVAYNTGNPGLAFLFDKNENVIMAGFLTDERKEISVSTTSEVLLYLGFKTIFLPDDIKDLFIDKVNEIQGFSEFDASITQLFKTNPLMLNDGSYVPLLKEKVNEIIEVLDSDINSMKKVDADGSDIRSGLQLNEKDYQSFSIRNRYRRRAHAFLYKTSYKDKAGNEVIVDDEISGADKAQIEKPIAATGALGSVTGSIGNWLAGKGAELIVTETSPIVLPLDKDNESEATYQLAVLGPGNLPDHPIMRKPTTAENERLLKLNIETFIIDLAFPIVMEVMGHKELVKKIKNKNISKLMAVVEKFINASPPVYDALQESDFKKAVKEFMLALAINEPGSYVEDFFTGFYEELFNISIDDKDYYVKKTFMKIDIKRAVQIVKVFDWILQTWDAGELLFDINRSSPLEIWEVKVSEGKVTLSPKKAVAIPFKEKEFTVKVNNTQLSGSQKFEYRWSTTGIFGTIKDDLGNRVVSFTSISDKPTGKTTYYSELLPEDIDDYTTDDIKVEVFIKNGAVYTKVDADDAVVKIKNRFHSIVPDGVTIQGKTNLRLYLERPDGSTGIFKNDLEDYKVVWTTSGNYGLFSGTQNTVTIYDNNNIGYVCLDEDVEKGTETVYAAIYRKWKEDTQWELWEEVDGIINIANDDKKKVFIAPVSVGHVVFGGPPYYMTLSYSYVGVPIEPDAVSYHVEVLKHYWGWNGSNNIPYPITTWTNDNYGNMLDQNPDEYQPRQAYATYAADNQNAAKIQARFNSIRGYAQVTIVLK